MTPSKRRKGRTLVRAWGGFVDGKLYVLPRHHRPSDPQYDEPRYAVFPSRKAAKTAYQDVRRVTITVED